MSISDQINKPELTKTEKEKLLKNKASAKDVKAETEKVLAKRVNAIKSLSGK